MKKWWIYPILLCLLGLVTACLPITIVAPASPPAETQIAEPKCPEKKCSPPAPEKQCDPCSDPCRQIDYQQCCCEKAGVFHYNGYGLNPDDSHYWRYIVKLDDDIVSISATFYSKQNWRWWPIVYLDNQIICGFTPWWNPIWDPDLLYGGQILRIRKLEYITQSEIQDAIMKSYQHKYSFDHDYCRLGDGFEQGWLKEKGICEPSKPDWVEREINSRCKQDCR